jgi:hypothetical protein
LQTFKGDLSPSEKSQQIVAAIFHCSLICGAGGIVSYLLVVDVASDDVNNAIFDCGIEA